MYIYIYIYIYIFALPRISTMPKVSFDCFEIIDCAFSYFRLQIMEEVHINWKKSQTQQTC